VTAIGEDEIEVQIGMLRVRARRSDVLRKGETEAEDAPSAPKAKKGKITLPPTQESPGFEMDMRGHRVDDGLEALERYLEKAYLAGLPFVRIIHGKGTGRLRPSVREALESSPFVDRYEAGGNTEGGEGVTVAHLQRE
jgi:DNA mismatch repair protein MutS2